MTEKVYYRSNVTGIRGWLVEGNDGPRIRLDQLDPETVRFTNEWQPETIRPPLNRMQASRIAWAADRELARWLGEPVDNRKDWITIDDDKRIDFAERGPNAGAQRRRVWKAIMEALECSEP